MRRSARLSAISGSETLQNVQEPEDSLHDVTAILNAEASNSNRTPTSKRKRNATKQVHHGESPSKRREVQDVRASTLAKSPSRPSTIRSSGKLKARPSLALRPLPSKRDAYDLPESPTDGPEPKNLMSPPVKMRVLNKRKQLPVSPFRGRGEFDTRSTATVYLDDSPRKAVTKNTLQKIGSSFLNLKPPARQQASTDIPFNGDVFAEALVASDGPDTPILLPSQVNKLASTEADSRTPVKRRIAQPLSGQVKAAARNGPPSSTEHDQEQISEKARVPNPLAHAVVATQTKSNSPRGRKKKSTLPDRSLTAGLAPKTPVREISSALHAPDASASDRRQNPGTSRPAALHDREVADDNDDTDNINNRNASDEEDPEQRGNEDGDDDSFGKATNCRPEAEDSYDQQGHQDDHDVQENRPKSRVQRPETEAERRRRKQLEAEEEDAEARRVRKAMNSINEAAEIFDCKLAWQTALVASAEITEERAYSELRSTNGKAIARSLRSLAEAYKELIRHGNNSDAGGSTATIQKDLQVYKQRCQHISECRHSPILDRHQDRRRERKHMIWDIYEHLVPDSLKLAKYVLRAQYQANHLNTAALREMIEVLKVTRLLANSATQWQPRPKVPVGIRRKVQLKVAQNVEHIIRQYQEKVSIEDQEIYRDELEIKQRADHERFLLEVQRRRAAVREKHLTYAARISREPVDQVVDVGDSNQDEPLYQHGQSRFSQPNVVGSPPDKAFTHREPTQESGRTAAKQWSSSELELLLNALQKYTSPTRFEDIIAAYGGYRGRLGKYNKDEIIAQARWVKKSILRESYDFYNGQWDWLLSLPD
ncbi:hypothetical protein PV08_07283 [Exophiala spinifera]|uniref:Uncharacterized protein n=1 Tax=Exophiala spinifera TaxID=91928 RepID=A0A0D2BTF5_9EURO|nr:uncharacterized protein PV08_07283 [Exophiala spinifera]KIW14499.1 hypothetical protein PV08_07283 [Exophiala spinifera]